MTPSARVQAAIDLLDLIISAARDNGPAADVLVARYFKERRYAGSKDRRAVRDLLYRAIRLCGERPESGRGAMIAVARGDEALAELFDGSAHGPAPLGDDEPGAEAGAVPRWLIPELYPFIDGPEQAALLERAPLDIRVNRMKGTVEQARTLLPEAKPVPDLPNAMRLPEGFALEGHEAWNRGLVEVQDAGSQHICGLCAAQPGETVIDLCAGAGGKTLALADAMLGRGRLIAADINRDRLSRLMPRAQRAGAGFIETLLLDQAHEGRALAPLTGKADLVLIDAPCSGTGTWRRNPEARWRLTPDRLARYASEQARILDMAAPLVKPGGRIVYAVCSLNRVEGEGQMEAFLRRHSEWRAKPVDMPVGRSTGHGIALTPLHDHNDGFFMAELAAPAGQKS